MCVGLATGTQVGLELLANYFNSLGESFMQTHISQNSLVAINGPILAIFGVRVTREIMSRIYFKQIPRLYFTQIIQIRHIFYPTLTFP